MYQWLKWFCEAGGGAHLTNSGWIKPHTHSNPTNLALFMHKITLYRFNQGGGAHTIAGGSNGSRGLSPLPPHFNHWYVYVCKIVTMTFCSLSKSIEPRVTKFGNRPAHGAEDNRSKVMVMRLESVWVSDCLYKHNVTADFSDGRMALDRQTNEIGKTISRSAIVLDFRRI